VVVVAGMVTGPMALFAVDAFRMKRAISFLMLIPAKDAATSFARGATLRPKTIVTI
jgi:hypothetical protein